MKIKMILFAGGLLLVALSSQAQSTFEISPFYGYRFGGSVQTVGGQDLNFKDGPAYGLALDITPYSDSPSKFELLWSRQDSGIDLPGGGGANRVKMTIDEFQIGGVLGANEGRLRPYFNMLVGATLFGPEGSDAEARFSFSIGGGVNFFLFKHLALRADARGFCTVVESDSAFISTPAGTVVRFSGSTLWQGEVSAGVTLSF